jgi:hypothetical protein
LQSQPAYLQRVQSYHKIVLDAEEDILNHKNKIKKNKISRDEKRIWAEQNLDFESYKLLQKELSQQSKEDNILLKKMNHFWGLQKLESQKELQLWLDQINQLKELRKQKSSDLQKLIFTKYTFLNAKNEFKSLGAIFENNPPAGAGFSLGSRQAAHSLTMSGFIGQGDRSRNAMAERCAKSLILESVKLPDQKQHLVLGCFLTYCMTRLVVAVSGCRSLWHSSPMMASGASRSRKSVASGRDSLL